MTEVSLDLPGQRFSAKTAAGLHTAKVGYNAKHLENAETEPTTAPRRTACAQHRIFPLLTMVATRNTSRKPENNAARALSVRLTASSDGSKPPLMGIVFQFYRYHARDSADVCYALPSSH